MSKIDHVFVFMLSVIFFGCKQELPEPEDQEVVVKECKCHIETARDTYIYPIRPGSDKWNSFESSDQMVAATQIPFEILDTMSTLGVMETCFENPLFSDLYLVDYPQAFYNFYSKTFNVCIELKNRPDATQKLIERYSLMCPDCSADNNYSNLGGKGGTVTFSFDAIELLLAQEDFLGNTTPSQRRELTNLVMDKYLKKKENNFSLYHQIYSIWIAGRLMEQDGYLEMTELIKKKEEIAVFMQTGTILRRTNSNTTVDEIISWVWTAFKNYKLNNL